MKTNRNIISLFLTFVLALSPFSTFGALADNISSNTPENNINIQNMAYDYIDYRADMLEVPFIDGAVSAQSIQAQADGLLLSLSQEIMEVTAARSEGFYDNLSSYNITLLDISVSASKFDILSQDDDEIVAQIYEITEYTWTVPYGETITSSFGTWHTITFDKADVENGYVVVKDEFCENSITDVCTLPECDCLDLPVQTQATVYSGSAMGSFSEARVISYCAEYYEEYNPDYMNMHIPGSSTYRGDCANFASQALKEAGLDEFDEWYYDDRGTDYTWDDLTPSGWRGAAYLIDTLAGHYLSISGAPTSSAVFSIGSLAQVSGPHIYICSRVNAGVPGFSSHTENRHNVTVNLDKIVNYLHIHNFNYRPSTGEYECCGYGCDYIA